MVAAAVQQDEATAEDDEGIAPQGHGLPLGRHKQPLAYVDWLTETPTLAELAST